MLRTTQNLVVAQPNQAPARSRSDLTGRLVRLNGHLDQVLAIGVVALQARDERHGPHLTPAGASYPTRSGLSYPKRSAGPVLPSDP